MAENKNEAATTKGPETSATNLTPAKVKIRALREFVQPGQLFEKDKIYEVAADQVDFFVGNKLAEKA